MLMDGSPLLHRSMCPVCERDGTPTLWHLIMGECTHGASTMERHSISSLLLELCEVVPCPEDLETSRVGPPMDFILAPPIPSSFSSLQPTSPTQQVPPPFQPHRTDYHERILHAARVVARGAPILGTQALARSKSDGATVNDVYTDWLHEHAPHDILRDTEWALVAMVLSGMLPKITSECMKLFSDSLDENDPNSSSSISPPAFSASIGSVPSPVAKVNPRSPSSILRSKQLSLLDSISNQLCDIANSWFKLARLRPALPSGSSRESDEGYSQDHHPGREERAADRAANRVDNDATRARILAEKASASTLRVESEFDRCARLSELMRHRLQQPPHLDPAALQNAAAVLPPWPAPPDFHLPPDFDATSPPASPLPPPPPDHANPSSADQPHHPDIAAILAQSITDRLALSIETGTSWFAMPKNLDINMPSTAKDHPKYGLWMRSVRKLPRFQYACMRYTCDAREMYMRST